MRQMWEAQAASRGQQSPQNLTPSQLEVLINIFAQKVFFSSQPQPGEASHPPQPSGPADYQILMMNSDEVNPSDINL